MLRVPVYEILENMSFVEYMLWGEYFKRRPYEWRDDLRAAQQMRSMGTKSSPDKLFPSLAMMKANERVTSNVPRPGSLMFEAMQNAKGGDRLEFLKDL